MSITVDLTKEKINILENVNLAKYTSLKVGGHARYMAIPKKISDIEKILPIVKDYNLELEIIANGTNCLISDHDHNKFFLNMSSYRGVSIKGNIIVTKSGEKLDRLITKGIEHNLIGLENLGGLPGTIGGALKNNSGANGSKISDLFLYADVLDKNFAARRVVNYEDAFSDRKSPFNEDDVILDAAFKMIPTKLVEEATKTKLNYLNIRKDKGEFKYPSAGCIFKNPKDNYAGKLIDSVGLKGTRIGGALISPYHGNFIVNEHKAKASDIYQLAILAREKVAQKYNIDLEFEVRLIGEF